MKFNISNSDYEKHRWIDFHGTRRMSGLRIGDVLLREDFDLVYLPNQSPDGIPFGPLEELARESKKYTVLGRPLIQGTRPDIFPELLAYKCGNIYVFGPPKITEITDIHYKVNCKHCNKQLYYHTPIISKFKPPQF